VFETARRLRQGTGGHPFGLAFWINGQLSDWDPTFETYDNVTNVTTTASRALHPCTDREELAAVGAPAGIDTTATSAAPSVRRRAACCGAGRSACAAVFARVRLCVALADCACARAGLERGVPARDGRDVRDAHRRHGTHTCSLLASLDHTLACALR
jgi:hypothetical protein